MQIPVVNYWQHVEHAQIVEPSDFARFKELNIIPSMQPVHATSDMHMAEDNLASTV